MSSQRTDADQEHFRKLERMYVGAAINRYYEPQIEIAEGRADITIQIRPDFFHAAGAIHGSVYFKALDDAAFFAANSTVSDVFVLTVSFTIYFTRPVSKGELRATGTVVHRSRNLVIAEAVAYDSEGHMVARGSGTFMRSQVPLSPAIGYV
jgi:uncharacterized protein (TIGR00369 family)